MIDIRHLTHVYPGTRKSPPRTALSDVTLSVADGEFCILSGPNGSGKSTLFRILCGMILPSAGRVSIAGLDLMRAPALARAQMAVVFQSPAVDPHLSVAENLQMQAELYGLRGHEFIQRAKLAVQWTELRDRLSDKVGTLSGGLSRQVELAKCLLTRPRLLLLDEPTTGLDPVSRRSFLATLQTLQREQEMTVFMTSHIFSEAEDADRVVILKEGHLLAVDTPQVLRGRLGREMVVVQSRLAEVLEGRIRTDLGLLTRRHGDEIRLEETENGAGLPILEELLARYRADIDSIAIRQPTLEDVFIHLTGNAIAEVPGRLMERAVP
jgi:ABC-2 type transport system ATP-binding protein